ncbi:hypothetical protein Bca52824_022943 [Brassica carinata]|uniref:DUF1985 domain-containing protein n=1 Tax=Brassica carinata TaxID=52824 RepID=A0A8X7VHJ6_BRACI|nr:hypothetical protein Bca52824_022943 [Brassica carinata]
MVSPSSVTPSRRVTRSQSAGDRKPNLKKTSPESHTRMRPESTDQQEAASTEQDEAASTEEDEAASTKPEVVGNTSTFPERLFARNCYPGKPRLNIYSKASIIGSLPLRFSLREFGDITGLKCEPEREKVGNGSESSDATPGRMWKELFQTEDEDVTVADVLRMLKQPSLPEWKRLPLDLIALVDGLLVCGHKLLRLTPPYVEMLEDTGYFLQYPWGREAFVSTLSRLTPPQPSDPSKMDKSLSVMRLRLKQQSTECMAIPSLLEKIPEPNKTTTFLEEPEGCDSTNTLLNFEDILLVETQAEVIVTYSILDEGGDPKWEKEVIDPRINNLVRGMREGHEFKATDFRGCDSSLPPLKPAEKGEGVGTPQRPIRPRRGIRKQAEPENSTDKEQELKEWIRVELKTQLGKLRDQFFDWLHHDRGGSFTVPQNTADGKTNRDNNHADPTGMEVPKKRRPYSGDGIDEAEKCGSDSKKHKKNNGDGFSEDETMRMHDNHCDGRVKNTDLFGQGEVGDESPISGLNLLAEEVEKRTWSDNVYKDPQENSCRILTVWPHPKSYVLPEDVTEEQAGKASPTNSEDYKTPPEDDPMTESRTPDVGMTKRSRYLTREFEIFIGIHVSNQFFLSLARPTNWVTTEYASKATWRQLSEREVQICRLLQYRGHHIKVRRVREGL